MAKNRRKRDDKVEQTGGNAKKKLGRSAKIGIVLNGHTLSWNAETDELVFDGEVELVFDT